MDLEVTPGKSIGPVYLGMSRSEVRLVLGSRATSAKPPYGIRESDFFDDVGIRVEYDSDGRCEAIEAVRPSNPILFGKALIGLALSKAQNVILSLGAADETDLGCMVWRKLGVTLFVELRDEEESIATVTVFRQGYYDQYAGV